MKADRLVSLLLLLQSAPRRTARDLAERLEVSERTIYRDVDALAVSGIPIYTERGPEGGIALAEGYRKALMHFGEDEVRAIFISGSAILRDLGLGANMDRALEKLRGGFSEMQQRAAEKARGRVHVDQRRWNQSDPPVEQLTLIRRAVWDDRRLDLAYEDRAGTSTTRVVDPYGLVSKAGVWYLIARTAEGFRTFRVDRIRGAAERGDRFERDPSFELEAHWRESAASIRNAIERFTVTLRVSPEAFESINGYWPTERVDPNDPSVLRVHFASERAAIGHLVLWDDAVELLDPLALREPVAAHARRLLERYGESGATR